MRTDYLRRWAEHTQFAFLIFAATTVRRWLGWRAPADASEIEHAAWVWIVLFTFGYWMISGGIGRLWRRIKDWTPGW